MTNSLSQHSSRNPDFAKEVNVLFFFPATFLAVWIDFDMSPEALHLCPRLG